ncbi:MAG: slipin family protein [Nitrospirae bacterium]|nr:slipin family protein [Nitrospirota bacterium]
MSYIINTLPALIAIVFLIAAVGRAIIKVLKEYERGVIFTLGKVSLAHGVKGPGLILLFPIIQKMVKVDLRTVTMDVPPQDIVTKDNVTVKVNAVVYFRVVEPRKAILEVADYYYATSQIAQTTLRSILGQSSLDDLLSKRDEINADLQKIMAKIIHAEGEFQAAQKLTDAASIIATTPTAIQLRFLQTLTEVAADKNSTIVFPIPIDLFKPFLEKGKEGK